MAPHRGRNKRVCLGRPQARLRRQVGARQDRPVLKRSFPPVVDIATRVLILGSLPGERSLAAQRYYAHPQNQFWRLVGAAIGRDLVALDYPDRLAALLAAGVGLWDVVAEARRQGSTDAAIRDPVANDLPTLADTLPRLRALAFNGASSLAIGTRQIGHAGCPEWRALPCPRPARCIRSASTRSCPRG